MSALADMPIDLATILSNVAGALNAETVGNSKPTTKADVMSSLKSVLNV